MVSQKVYVKIVFIIMLLTFIATSTAQSLDTVWNYDYSSSEEQLFPQSSGGYLRLCRIDGDLHLEKYDDDRVLKWRFGISYLGSWNEIKIADCMETKDSAVVITGYCYKDVYEKQFIEVVTAKYSRSGTILWRKQSEPIENYNANWPKKLFENEDGSYTLFSSYAIVGYPNAVTFDSQGMITDSTKEVGDGWYKDVYKGRNNEYYIICENSFFSCIKRDSDQNRFQIAQPGINGVVKLPENVYVFCGDDSEGTFLLCVDLQGNKKWIKRYSTGKNDNFTDIVLTPNNEILVVGTKDNNGVILQTDRDGNTTYMTEYGNEDVERFTTISVVDDKLYIKGTTTLAVDSMKTDFVLQFRYDETGIDIDRSSKTSLLSIGNNRIHINNNRPARLEIFSSNGRRVHQASNFHTSYNLQTIGLARGIYQMRIIQGADIFTGQFMLK